MIRELMGPTQSQLFKVECDEIMQQFIADIDKKLV
jgi:hypothetical protein